MKTSKVLNKVGAISGLLVSILYFAGYMITDYEEISPYDTADIIASTYVENISQSLLGTYCLLMAAFFLIWFSSYLYTQLAINSKQNSWTAYLAYGGGLVAVTMILLEAHIIQSLTLLENYGNDAIAAKALFLLNYNWYLVVEAPALSAFVLGVSATNFQINLFPKWLAIWGVLNGLLLLSPFLPGSGLLLSMVWIGVLAFSMFIKEFRPENG